MNSNNETLEGINCFCCRRPAVKTLHILSTPFYMCEHHYTKYEEQKLATPSPVLSAEAIIAFRKAIDYEAEGLRMWYGECAKEGDLDSSTRHAYKFANNMLALLRRKVTPEHLEGLAKRNGPEAKMIYDEQPIERLERNRGIDRTFIIEGEIENFEITRIKPSDK